MILYSAFGLTVAQDLSVPTSWRKPSTARPFVERVSISQSAINAILPQLDSQTSEFDGIGFWQSGNVWSAMANQDRFSGIYTNKASVLSNVDNVYKLHPVSEFDYNDDPQWWAQAALYAYKAYGDSTMLDNAITTWNHITNYVITPVQASTGTRPDKSFSLASTCDGATMAGGVFWRPTADDQAVNSITTGLYVTLSAFLAEITRDEKYKNAAILSADWIKAHNVKNNVVLDTVYAHDCSRSPSSWIFTYNSGKFIEGLSVLADVTGDFQWRNLMVGILATAVKSSTWQGSDGIITEGSDNSKNDDSVGFKAIFIRGIYEAFARNPSNSGLRNIVRSYIDVQYNALLDLAANHTSFSANWHGPPQEFMTWGQLAALDVLTSAVAANN